MDAQKIKKGLFVGVLVLLFLPNIQRKFDLVEVESLSGVFTITEKPDSLRENWMSSRYQDQYGKYFKENAGFNEFFIRVFSQLQFSLFNTTRKGLPIIGRDDVLYDTRYIKTALGKDFLGNELVDKKVKDLSFIKEELKKEGKRLLIVMAPNKARYFWEEVPNYFRKEGETNYAQFLKKFKSYNIDYIDFNEWALSKKKEAKVNLIPKYGIHWSTYAAHLAGDSIAEYCNNRYGYNLPRMIIDSSESTLIPRETDCDLGESLNLLFPLSDEEYIYPFSRIVKNKETKKKNLLVIADSFFGAIHRSKFSGDIFNMAGYWYYNRELRFKNKRSRKKNTKDFISIFPNTDLVIILQTEWNLERIGFGFVEELKAYYLKKPDLKVEKEKRKIDNQIRIIRASPDWMNSVEAKANIRNITVDSMLVRTAKFVLRNKEKKH